MLQSHLLHLKFELTDPLVGRLQLIAEILNLLVLMLNYLLQLRRIKEERERKQRKKVIFHLAQRTQIISAN